MFQQHKKGISEIVSYMLLVVIAVGLSVLVFSFLKLYVPKEKPECKDGISLIVQNYSCFSTKNITATLSNKGRYSVDAAYVRIGTVGKRAKAWINRNDSDFYFNPALVPGNKLTALYNITGIINASGAYELEVQPALIVNDKLAACDNAIITQTITCTN